MARIVLAFGANINSAFGAPAESLLVAVEALNARSDIELNLVSSVYRSPPVGAAYQPDYMNLVASGETRLAPPRLLAALKSLERAFGRQGGLFWGPRPLDIDIIDFDQKIRNWGGISERGLRQKYIPLTLPHPRMHLRAFVLRPLEEILPHWRHPVLQQKPASLMDQYCSTSAVRSIEKLEMAEHL